MEVVIHQYRKSDIPAMTEIWNRVVEDANAFPQRDKLSEKDAEAFFAAQTFSGVAEKQGQILGLYILHPNNVGRCGHIANASYAVQENCRGYHIGEKLVKHSMKMGRTLGFLLLQFNAVVRTNTGAIHLYEKIGFHRIGVIPKGFLLGNGEYEDIVLYYIKL